MSGSGCSTKDSLKIQAGKDLRTVAVLFLLGCILVLSSAALLASIFIPLIAFLAVWSYLLLIPFLLLLVLPYLLPVKGIDTIALPTLLCVFLAPFATWYCRSASHSQYFAVCIILLFASAIWLLQAINTFFNSIAKEPGQDAKSWNTFATAIHFSFKSTIYFVIAPLCADMAGIVYKTKTWSKLMTEIVAPLGALRPISLAFLHYGGASFVLLFEAIIAIAIAYKLIRIQNDKTDYSS